MSEIQRPDWLRIDGRWAGEEIASIIRLGDDPTMANAEAFFFFTIFNAGDSWRIRINHVGPGGVDADDRLTTWKIEDRAEALAEAERMARELIEDLGGVAVPGVPAAIGAPPQAEVFLFKRSG